MYRDVALILHCIRRKWRNQRWPYVVHLPAIQLYVRVILFIEVQDFVNMFFLIFYYL